ncbi:uncharacterized protein LOC142232390 [Haematobia irritans]|uniref:uncharacterized protein LOC142232390 n=1 Tax=Haematobia irritans TaxID=7368 RepID=UPI003F4FE609
MDGDSDNERGSLLPRNSVDKEVSKECVDMRLKYVSSSEDDTDNIDWATDDEEANMPLVSKSHSAQDSSIDDNSHSAACCIDIEDNIELTQNMPKDNFSNETLKRSKVINNNSTLECTSSVAINVIQESGVMINDKKLEESCNDKLCVQIAEPNIDTEENPKGQDNQCTIVKPIIKTKSISHFPGTSTDTTMQYLGNISSSLKCRSMNDIHLDQDNCGRDSNQPKETEFPLQPSNSENTRQIDTVDEVVRVDSKYGSYEEEENKCGHDIQCVVVKPIVKTISISHFPGTSGDTSMKYLIANKQTPLKCRSMNDIPLEQGQCGTDSTQGDKQPELKLQCRNSANTGQIENQCDLSEDYTVKIDDVVRIGSTAENQNTEENNQSVIVKPIIKTISVSHFPGTTADTSMKYLMANDLTSLRCRSMNDIPSIQGQCGTDSTESNRQTEMQTINSGIMGEIEYNCDWPHQFTVKLDKVGRSESTDTEENKNGPDNQYVPINKTISYSHFPGTPTDTTMNYLIGNNPIYVKCRSMNDIPSSTTSNKCYKETKDTLQTTNTAIAGQVEDQCNLPEKYTEKLDVVGRADSLAESEGDFILIGKNLKANLFSKSENEISKLAKDISDIAVPKKLVAKSDNALVKHLESPTDLYMITNESTESDQQEFVNKTGNASSLVTLKSIQCSKDEDEEEMNTNQGPDEQMKPASNAVELQAQQSVKDLLENTNAVQKTIGLERMGSVSSLNKAYEKPYLQDLESDYLEKIDNSFQTDGSSEQNHLMYDQNISESLRNQLNRFDILIETMDQRNSRNIATNAAERGYWSTIFGQASENEAYDDIIPDIKAHRALELLEDYHSRLSEPQDRALRMAIERVIRIFKSRLFQALLDIQEFYELTLLDDSKTIQQKTVETLQIASKWEQDSVKIADNQAVKAVDTDGNQTKNEQNLTDVPTDIEQQQQTNGRQQQPQSGATDINSVSPYEVCFSSIYKM